MSFDEHAINAITNAIDFIEDSLKEEIRIADAANAASYSLYHFCRLFNQYVHHSPYDYIIRRRLTEATKELKNMDRHIIDIAFDYQFNNHETFSRAFKRFMGMQPNEWRKRGIHDRRFIFSRRTREHLEFINSGIRGKPEFIQSPEFIFAGISSFIESTEHFAQFIWPTLEKELRLIHNVDRPITFYGINTYLDVKGSKNAHYMAAVKVKTLDDIPPTLTIKRIPAGIYLEWCVSGSYQPAMDYLYQTYLSKSGRRPTYPFEIETIGHDWRRIKSKDDIRKILVPVVDSVKDFN